MIGDDVYYCIVQYVYKYVIIAIKVNFGGAHLLLRYSNTISNVRRCRHTSWLMRTCLWVISLQRGASQNR